ncbi:hypothetical protein OMW55_05140 [Sphingomonas sp. BN140010]|uniref:Uncharacterized protein n=1 Tax=Sphingomonas arvum TaxID=2992113 RepID=A0ABT3JDQ0_9SPHN|nr:hypothetical protein [Sphingomonas sp. BN140010]MCW3797192.1 hypothetical protein [Sphingomonas sp. BN140010]
MLVLDGHLTGLQQRTPSMSDQRQQAAAEFRRILKVIVAITIGFTIAAITYLGATGELYVHMVVAVIGGVFISVVLGCGLFAAAFFNDKSSHDRSSTKLPQARQRGERGTI